MCDFIYDPGRDSIGAEETPLYKALHPFSPILFLAVFTYYVLCLLSPIVPWFECRLYLYEIQGKRNTKHYWPTIKYWFIETWLFILIGSQLFSLFLKPLWWLACFGLVNSIWALLRDAVYSPLFFHGGKVLIRNPARWLIVAFLTTLQPIICFAILFKCFGNQFNPHITCANTALYYSIVNFTTLGYGDISPAQMFGRWLIIGELLFFLAFIGIRLPLAVSVLKVDSSRTGGIAPTEGKSLPS